MKRIVTYLDKKIVSLLLDGNDRKELNVYDPEQEQNKYAIGAVYIGKVSNIVKNLNAAFVRIGAAGEKESPSDCFLPLEDLQPNVSAPDFSPIFIKRNNPNTLCPGDELLVQIKREPIKTKPATLTTHLTFPGRYAVILPETGNISISRKIVDPDWKSRIKSVLEPLAGKTVGIIVRTNAYTAEEREVEDEIRYLIGLCEDVVKNARYRTVYSCLYMPDPLWLTDLRDRRMQGGLDEICTDDEALYRKMKEYLIGNYHYPEDKIVFEKDAALARTYFVSRVLEDALRKRVWLKSGAYLVIEPTEALTVIDVNTGKAINKKDMRSHILSINREAAAEAARQIRLRNLSGIILIDFINMPDPTDKADLLEHLNGLLSEDPVKTTLVGISKLDLVEITREKVRKPLHEMFDHANSEIGASAAKESETL